MHPLTDVLHFFLPECATGFSPTADRLSVRSPRKRSLSLPLAPIQGNLRASRRLSGALALLSAVAAVRS